MSPRCQETFTKLVCYDCDGDVGQRTRKGLCPSLCSELFKSCYHDTFSFEEKSQRFRFCRQVPTFTQFTQNDMMCSELRYIFKDGVSFCRGLGFEVNENTDFATWIDELLVNTTK
jgi:hypothetical protein